MRFAAAVNRRHAERHVFSGPCRVKLLNATLDYLTSLKASHAAEPRKGFLAALEETGSVTEAAKTVGMGRSNIYHYRRTDKAFTQKWDEALDVAADVLEDEARRRAYEGVEEPVFQGGKQVGTVRKYSDTLLIFLLKGIRPQRDRETRSNDCASRTEQND